MNELLDDSLALAQLLVHDPLQVEVLFLQELDLAAVVLHLPAVLLAFPVALLQVIPAHFAALHLHSLHLPLPVLIFLHPMADLLALAFQLLLTRPYLDSELRNHTAILFTLLVRHAFKAIHLIA